jgi:hypothetical protein
MAKKERKRGVLLTLWIILMLIFNGMFALLYLLGGKSISSELTTLPIWAIYLMGVLSALNFVYAIFLYKWKKWPFYAFCGSAIIAFVVNLIAGINIVSALFSLIIGPLVLYLIMRTRWNLFE